MNVADTQSRRHRRFGVVAAAYLTLYSLALWLWLRWIGVETDFFATALCVAPAALAWYLSTTSTVDRQQYILRVLACAALAPVLLLFWGTSLDVAPGAPQRAVWPFAVGAGAAHTLAFVGLIFWGGAYATRMPAATGTLAIGADDLRARLMSLNDSGAPLQVRLAVSGDLAVGLPANENRTHVVILKLDAAKSQVSVRERLTAVAARPSSADEASMRGPGDHWFDPARPDAISLSSVTVQTSTIDDGRLAAMPVQVTGRLTQIPADLATSLDTDGMVVLLCAVVTRSGWHWQPVFLANAN